MPTNTSFFEIIMAASLPVQLVVLTLSLMSIISWYYIREITKRFKRIERINDDFTSIFWGDKHNTVENIYYQCKKIFNEDEASQGIIKIFYDGYQSYKNMAHSLPLSAKDKEMIYRKTQVTLHAEADALEENLPLLATIGSISPYIGLFGTVWGIMSSFHSIGAMQKVTIATIAPGISEALIATAIGLFAAIPSVIAFNHFTSKAAKTTSKYESFVDIFSIVLNEK